MPVQRKIVCPHCDAINKVPGDRPAQKASCGRCHQKLFSGGPVELEGPRFHKHLANSDVPLIVDFWAPWCGPCRSMAPTFDRAAQMLEPHARFVKVNVDANAALANEFGVQGIPALFAFQGGKVAFRHSGIADLAMLRGWVDRLAASSSGPHAMA